MRAYEAEPAYFIGHIEGPVYPEPSGDAVLTQAAQDAAAQIQQHLAGLAPLIGNTVDLSLDGAVFTQQAGHQADETHVGVNAMANDVRTSQVNEFAANVIGADGIRAYDLALLEEKLRLEDEGSTMSQLDEWAEINRGASKTIPPPGAPTDPGPISGAAGAAAGGAAGQPPPAPPPKPAPGMPPPVGRPPSQQLFESPPLGPEHDVGAPSAM